MSRAGYVAVGLLLPGLAWAAEESHAAHGPNWGMLAAAIFNAIVLLVLLLRFAQRPIRDFLVQRSRRIARAIEAAEGRLLEAAAEVQRWRAQLARVDEAGADIVRLAGQTAEAERERRLERARQTAARIRREAGELGEQEVARARAALRAEVAELAAGLAASLVRARLRPQHDRRLFSEYVDRIGARP